MLRFDFLLQGQVCFPMLLYGIPYICMGKMLRISNNFSSEAARPMLLKFHAMPPWGGGMKECKGRSPSTKMAAMLIYGKKKLLKIFFSRTEDVLGLNLCTNHPG